MKQRNYLPQRLQIINEDQSLEKVTKGMIRRTILIMSGKSYIDRSKDWNLEGIVTLLTPICAPDEFHSAICKGKAAEIEELCIRKGLKSKVRKTRAIEWRQSNA